jgi:hypothetical protein
MKIITDLGTMLLLLLFAAAILALPYGHPALVRIAAAARRHSI